MNKGLEVIEAHWLFGLPPEQIDVVIHPQSIVHSMVEYVDGSVLAQMGIPDMAIPISYILAYPERLPMNHLPSLDLPRAGRLDFAEPDREKFPCLELAYRALHAGGTMPAVLNAANEVVVEAFLGGQIAFLDIPRILDQVIDSHTLSSATDLETLLAADRWSRAAARTYLSDRVPAAAAG
jgi:1-deoxy-D-xylulose-5-phosphate reductoisomerase